MTNPFEICDRMNPELRKLLENYLRAADELHKYCVDNDTAKNEHSDPDNYVALVSVAIFANNEDNITWQHQAHAAAADRIQAARSVLENAFHMACYLERKMYEFKRSKD